MRHPSRVRLLNNRYYIHGMLGEGGMGAVFRATDRLLDRQVALKQVTVSPSDLVTSFGSAENSVLLAQEFRILSGLRHPHIISVYDYGFDADKQPFFTMTLLENAQPITEAARSADPPTILRWMSEVLQALRYLHRHGILHRDLKPSNILVQNGDAYVLDFGLAIDQPQKVELVGTVLYMSPESLLGQPTTIRSDLFALATVMYECFTGQHPIDAKANISRLIHLILDAKPDAALLGGKLPWPDVTTIILRLLEKDPADRFADADGVLDALQATESITIPIENAAIRESYLQAAKFIGREPELEQLTTALQRAMDHQGEAWLLAGESGIGKSRLVDEIRIRALVDGYIVLRGQAVESGGLPLQAWRDPVRALCLQTHITPEEAAILRPIVPDIEALIGQPVAAVPLDPSQAEKRLINTIIAIIERQTAPLLLLLEDVQWASESGLVLLGHLRAAVKNLPVLVVATLRTDTGMVIASAFEQWRQIRLRPFNDEQMAQLAVAMLGESLGSQSDILALMAKETEGNIYFATEVARSLAELAGDLRRIENISLPQHIMSEGIEVVVRRRLSQIPADGQRLLALAAIGGRRLDLAVLARLAGAVSLDDWLAIGAAAHVFDIRDEQWRFAHDRLRDVALADISSDARAGLHLTLANAITATYGDDPRQFVALAHHFEQSGQLRRAADYLFKAARTASTEFALQDAIKLAQRAAALYEQSAADDLTRAEIGYFLADMTFQNGAADQAFVQYLQTAALLGLRLPTDQRGLMLGLLNHVLRHALHELLPWWRGRRSAAVATLEARVVAGLGFLSIFRHEGPITLYYTLKSANLATQAPRQLMIGETARRYTLLLLVSNAALPGWLTRHYARRGKALIDTAMTDTAPSTVAYLLVALAYVAIANCQWDEAESYSQRTIHLREASNDFQLYEFSVLLHHDLMVRWGRLNVVRQRVRETYVESVRLNAYPMQSIALIWQAVLATMAGDFETAQAHIAENETISDDYRDRSDRMVWQGCRLLFHTLRGDLDAAAPFAEKVDAMLGPNAMSFYVTIEPIAWLAEYYFARYTQQPTPELAAKIEQVIDYAKLYQTRFALGKARYPLLQGRWLLLQGQRDDGLKLLAKAATIAQKLDLRLDAALIAYHRYRATEAATLLEEARTRLSEIGAGFYRGQLPAAPDKSAG